MRLTVHTDYALRMMIFVAARRGERATIGEIADAYGISKNHLMKVATALQRTGYLNNVRGKGGGLELAQTAETVRLGALVCAMENDMMLAECFGPDNACVITPHCRLKSILAEALASFIETLDRYTLADVTGRSPRGLRKLLRIA
jgi:Rrf2 family transcriptional regulator, nitric oxide-sensitive transcriptional repressor